MASGSAPHESWVAQAKGRLFPRKRGQQLVAEWQQRRLPAQFFGVARHAERADDIFAFWNGQRWTCSDDFRRWPLDPPLSDDGMEAARAQGFRVQQSAAGQGTAVQVVISSPYFRCVQTAALICKALGPSARLLIDWSLGEVYGPSVMGEQEPAEPVRGMDSTLAFCRAHGVRCEAHVVGRWPCWPETLQDARRRYAIRFLSYLQRSVVTQRNFVLVAHADTVGAVLSMMPSLLDRSVERVEYGGMLLAARRSPRAAGQRTNFSSVIPMAVELEGSDPEEFLPESTVADFEDAADANPRAIGSAWTAGDASGARHPSREPSESNPPPNPPKAVDGWEVDLHDITMRKRRMAAKFEKRVQDIASRGPFTQDRIRELLGCMGGKPLSEEEHLPSPGVGPTSCSDSTLLFGAEDPSRECPEDHPEWRNWSTPTTPASLDWRSRSTATTPASTGEPSDTGASAANPIQGSIPRLVSSVCSLSKRQPLRRSRQQRECPVQITEGGHVGDEGAAVQEQVWAQSIAEQAETANAEAPGAASDGCTGQPPLGRQRQPPSVVDDAPPPNGCLRLVGGASSSTIPAGGADDPRKQSASSDQASEHQPAGSPKPVSFRSFGSSSLMQRRLKSKATT